MKKFTAVISDKNEKQKQIKVWIEGYTSELLIESGNEELIKEYNVEKIVLGFPKNMNNSEGERCEKTLEFKEMLERRTGLTVELWDERLTTVAADNLMMEAGIRRENRKEYVDQIAASFILQGYLDYLQNEKNQE